MFIILICFSLKWALTCCSWGWCLFPGPCQYMDLHGHTATHTCPGSVCPKHAAPRHTGRLVSSCPTGPRCLGWPGCRTSRLTLLGHPLCLSADACSLETGADIRAHIDRLQHKTLAVALCYKMCDKA